jgi:hypothetical protein
VLSLGKSSAALIREQGLDGYGFGEQKTPESFGKACKRFTHNENLLPQPGSSSSCADARGEISGIGTNSRQPPGSAIPLIQTALSQLEDMDGWHFLGTVGLLATHWRLSAANARDPETSRAANASACAESRPFANEPIADLSCGIYAVGRR